MSEITIRHGDSREVLKELADASIHAVVCDPPYALVSIGKRFGAENAAPVKPGKTGAYARASAGFMGKKWDTGETAFDPEFWVEVLRVLKPGGHVVAFGGTRTYHRLACAIEDAGFEIRDMVTELIASDTHVRLFLETLNEEQTRAFIRCIDESQFGGMLSWVFGSGFPKSHDVSKGIAKRRVEDEEPVRRVCRFVRDAMDKARLKSRDLAPRFDCDPRLIDHWAARDTDSQPSLPKPEQWVLLKDALNLSFEMDDEVARLNGRKGALGGRWSEAEIIATLDPTGTGGLPGQRMTVRDPTVRRLDVEALQWQGWGTALKPALEPIVLARKPLIGTVAANVLAHGTGALNIDAARIKGKPADFHNGSGRSGGIMGENRPGRGFAPGNPDGRWPANVCLSYLEDEYELSPYATAEQRREVYRWLSENA